jgi:hypothetical protein
MVAGDDFVLAMVVLARNVNDPIDLGELAHSGPI